MSEAAGYERSGSDAWNKLEDNLELVKEYREEKDDDSPLATVLDNIIGRIEEGGQ